MDILVGATAPDGGALVVDYDFSEPFEVYESTIVGGFVLWSGSDPGFGLIEFEEPEEGVFPMVSDVEISFEITELDSGVQFQFGDATLDEVGESVVLGNSSDLHGHGEWQVILPEGVESGEYILGFRLVADRIYAPSEAVEALLVPIEGDEHGHDDEHHDDEHDDEHDD